MLQTLMYAKYRRYSFFGTMDRYGPERNGTRTGTVSLQNDRNGKAPGPERNGRGLEDTGQIPVKRTGIRPIKTGI